MSILVGMIVFLAGAAAGVLVTALVVFAADAERVSQEVREP